MGMWYANERVSAESYDDGELTVICGVNWTENEQDWSSVQFISTATGLSVNIIYPYIYRKMKFIVFLLV